jgi:Tfp pilus assembly protein PilF
MKSILALGVLLYLAPPQAVAGDAVYQLVGKVLAVDHTEYRHLGINVFLQGVSAPFETRAPVDASGAFTFKNLRQGIYVLVVVRQRSGESRKSVEIGPSFADDKGRIFISVPGEQQSGGKKRLTVSSTTLSVPDVARQLYRKAMDLLGKRDKAGAICKLKEAVQIAPQFVAAWNNLGTIAYQSGDFDEAEICFRESLRQDPDSDVCLVNLGGVLLSERKYQDALPYNLQAVNALPDDPAARSQLGRNYCFLGRDDEAEVQLKEAKRLDPSHFSYPQLILSQIYGRKQDYSSMARELEEFLELHPDSRLAGDVRISIEAARTLMQQQLEQ